MSLALPPSSGPQRGPCPCGSGRPFAACCGPIIARTAPAPTAEALMRSRYTAFSRRNVDHLQWSWHSTTRPPEVELNPTTTWTGLVIARTVHGGPGDDSGIVEFEAAYQDLGGPGTLREVSRFVKEDGRWVYLGGVHG